MIVTSLYAVGPARIEVGKYGMPLQEALDAFSLTCESHNLKPKITRKENKIFVAFDRTKDWSEFHQDLANLLDEVANVVDLHGDAPDAYILASDRDIPENQYVKTGCYND